MMEALTLSEEDDAEARRPTLAGETAPDENIPKKQNTAGTIERESSWEVVDTTAEDDNDDEAQPLDTIYNMLRQCPHSLKECCS